MMMLYLFYLINLVLGKLYAASRVSVGYMEWSYPLLKYDFLVNLLVTLWVVKPCEQSYLNQMTKGLEVDME